jgi:predicted O-linked N-acetylglucosamine transferase (SPINDLY family)
MTESEYGEWMDRGRAHQRDGRPIDAMLCYERAARGNPDSSDPHFALGEVQWQLGRLPGALAAWREASRITRNYMAPVQAEAEALLAIGDTGGAVAAAKRVQSLMPQDARAALIRGIGALVNGDPDDPAPAAAIDALLAREPSLLAIPTLAGPLALALEHAPAGAGREALLGRIAHSPDVLAHAVPQLLAVALEHVARTDSFDGDMRARIAAVACSRNYTLVDHELLRRAARAVSTFDVASGRALANLYAILCAKTFSAPVPLLWPVRTAGTRWRIVVLAGDAAASDANLAALRALPEDEFDITLATIGEATAAAIPGLTVVALPASADADAARIIAARDPDVVVDLVGLAASTGPLLARRPARAIVTAASIPVPNGPPLVDRVAADAAALAAMLVADRSAHDFARDCARDVASLARQWDAAVGLHKKGDRKGASAQYGRVLAQQPGYAPALHLAGVACRDDGDLEGALARFSGAIEAAPGFVDARIAAMRAASALGRHERAIALGEEGVVRMPGNASVLRALGQAELARRNGAAASVAFAGALAIEPTDGETHFHHGVALQMMDDVAEAARAYQRALVFRPDLVAAHFNLGVLFQKQGVHEGAAEAFTEVLKAEPGNIAAWKYRGEALIAGARVDEFIVHFRQFAARHPRALPLAVQAIEACQYLADFNLLEQYLDGLRNDRFVVTDELELVDAMEQLLYLLLYVDVEPELVFKLALAYDGAARRVYGEPMPRPERRRPGRLRIGYLSADLRNHVMGKMVWSAVQHHDRERFELYFYALSAVDDDWTARFRGIAHGFESLAHVSERAAAQRIAQDDLDILVDLSTHTKGAKPGILAAKPARVQITHVASSGTVGLSTIDFKLTDRFADVPENGATQIETLLPMDGCVYPYRHVEVAVEHPFHRATLGIAAETIVIGAFVSGLKLTRRCLSLWREVLERVPAAELAFSPVNPALRALYLRLAAAAGIAADRLLFLPQGRDDGENQARYALVDFVVDPMPYGGVNGVLEPLDAGVPVVTLVGKRHGERTAYSILANLGVTATVARSGREYVEIAVRLATDQQFMREVRERIRAGISRSPLTDCVGHTRALERAYLAALEQRAPEALAAAGAPADG